MHRHCCLANYVVLYILKATSRGRGQEEKGKGEEREERLSADAQNNRYNLGGDRGSGRGNFCLDQETEREMKQLDHQKPEIIQKHRKFRIPVPFFNSSSAIEMSCSEFLM